MTQTIRITQILIGSDIKDTNVFALTYNQGGEEVKTQPGFITAGQIKTGKAVVVIPIGVTELTATCQSGLCAGTTSTISLAAATPTPTPTGTVTPTPTNSPVPVTPTPTATTPGATPTNTPIPVTPTSTPRPVTPTSTPAPVSPTPTPTKQQPVEEFYDLEKCTDSSEARTANTTDSGAFTNGDIVVDSSGAYYTVVGITNRITGNVGTVTSTALSECPSAPTEFQPSVTSYAADPVGTSTATFNGTVTNVGNPNYTQKGFVWKTGTGDPTLADTVINVSGTSTGDFSSNVTGLTPGSRYTYRAFATNTVGTTYGDSRSVDTNLIGYYQLQDCSTLSTQHRTSQTIEDITLGNSDRVESGGVTYIVVGSTNDTGLPAHTVTDTGLQGCPATERYYNYEECDGGGITGVAKWPSGTTLSNGNAFYFNECFRITTETTGPNFGDFDLTGYTIYNDCTDCNNANQPVPDPTPTASKVAQNCYEYELAADGGETVTFVYTDCNDGNLRNVTVPNGDSVGVCARDQNIGEITMNPNSGTITQVGTCGTFGAATSVSTPDPSPTPTPTTPGGGQSNGSDPGGEDGGGTTTTDPDAETNPDNNGGGGSNDDDITLSEDNGGGGTN